MMTMEIIIDTREQSPYTFRSVAKPAPPVQRATLATGDYSILGCETEIAIERKSKNDLYQSVTRGRDRFEREFERMSRMDFAAVVIECSFESMFTPPRQSTAVNPKTPFRTLLAWCQRYRVPFFNYPTRAHAEKATFLLLHYYWKDQQENAKGMMKKGKVAVL